MAGRRTLLTHDGITDSISGWSRRVGLSPDTISLRLKRGESVPEALGPRRHRCDRWTDREEALLRAAWGVEPIDNICERLGRTRHAVRFRAYRMGLPAPSERSWRMGEVVRVTGYDESTIRSAASALRLHLRRVEPLRHRQRRHGYKRGHYAITPEQLDQIVKYLKERTAEHDRLWRSRTGEWGKGGRTKKPKACVECKTTERAHVTRGLCTWCYGRKVRSWQLVHRCCVRCGTTDRNHASGGLCTACHTRPARTCAACGESRPHRARGLCDNCYERRRYHKKGQQRDAAE